MNAIYGRDLDLNLLRVFVAVADTGSATQAAARLYLTQPAISAALRRLTNAVGSPLFAREGRGLVLTERGECLLSDVRPRLLALVDAVLSPPQFDPTRSERTMRVGLSDSAEHWLLPQLVDVLGREAPRMRVVAVPVQFRTVQAALLTRRVDLAVTVADELPPSIERKPLFRGEFVCLFDPRHARIGRTLSERTYFEHQHVVVSYNGDLRGVVEDALQRARNVRCSVSSFWSLGALVLGTDLLATVPRMVATQIQATFPVLRTLPLPFALGSTPMELLWPTALDEDQACRFVRAQVEHIATNAVRARSTPRPKRLRASRSRARGARPQ